MTARGPRFQLQPIQVCRFGLDGTLVHPKTYEAMPLREDILTTLRRLGPLANKLGAQPALDHLYQAATDGSDATYLRRQYEVRGSCEGMVDAAIAQFRGGRR